MIIFYHGDMDGIASANIFINNCINMGHTNFTPIEFIYDKQNLITDIDFKDKECVFVDCCPNAEVLNYVVASAPRVTILDHHISQKEVFDNFYKEGLINGYCYIGASATLITWCWFHFLGRVDEITNFLDKFAKSKFFQEQSKVPYGIRLVNSWDIWNKMYDEAEPYKIYFETQNFNPFSEKAFNLLHNTFRIEEAIEKGRIMMQYFRGWNEQYIKRFGYEVQYEDKTFFVANIGCANSKVFGDKISDYDAVIIYCYDGNLYRCSIYTEKEDFDCSIFAKNLGGGGHKKAAGFVLKEMPIWLKNKKGEDTNDKN